MAEVETLKSLTYGELQTAVREGRVCLPRTEADSIALGYTGEQCAECGQRTLIAQKNRVWRFLVCAWCDQRKPLEHIENL